VRKLKVISGKDRDKGREFQLPMQGQVILGRALDTITQFVDTLVSGKHCHIDVNGDAVYLTDRNSSNGTFVGLDEKSLARLEPNKSVELKDGHHIRLGNDTELVYVDETVHQLRTVRAPEEMLAQLRAATAQTKVEPDRPRPGSIPGMPPLPLPLGSSNNLPVPPGLLGGTSGSMPLPPALGGTASGNIPSLPANTQSASLPASGTIKTTCTYCGQQLVAKEQYAGMQVRCPTCRNMCTLPGSKAPPSLTPGANSTSPPLPPPSMPSVPKLPPPSIPSMPGAPPAPPSAPQPPSVFQSMMPGAPPSSTPSWPPFPPSGSSGNMPVLPPVGTSGNVPAFPGVGTSMVPTTLPPTNFPMQGRSGPGTPGGPPSMPGMPMGMGTMYPPGMQSASVEAFQMPPVEQPKRGLRPIHLILLTVPVVLIVIAIVILVRAMLG